MDTIISSIRDILRKEGITGIDSINHCILFVVSRMLTVDMCKKIGIDQQYAFENLLKNENGDDIGDQSLYDRVYNHKKDCLVGQIMYVLGFMNMKFKLEGIYNLKLIYDKLRQFDIDKLSSKCDIIGTIYEIHLKSGTSNSMRDLGQYYTNRQVIQYMISLCDPHMKDGLIEKIVDPTMGTGGFLTMSIKYLNKKYNDQIDWTKNKDHIIGFDIDENVKNMALLNVFLEIYELCKQTLVKQDTLHCDLKFTHDDTILDKADIILANEPMGLKNIVYDECCDRIKNMNIKGTKSEPLFLQLFMNVLNEGGRCAVIVPDGMLFNESNLHSETRKYLVENFDLKKVVSLNDEFFLNTGVKTSILFFTKNGQSTKEIEFSRIYLKNDQIVETSMIKVTHQQILDNKYSLFISKYTAEKVNKIEGVEYKRLGEICCFLPTTKYTSSFGKESGLYRFYNSSQTDKLYLDTFEVNNDSIIIGNGGNICIHYDRTFTPSKHVTVCQLKMTNIDLKYIYYYLLLNVDKLKQMSAGSTIQWLNKTNISSLEIPIPPLSIQQTIVERLDILSSNNDISHKMIEDYYKIMKYYIDCKTKNGKEYKMGDICETMSGEYVKSADFVEGIYPVYGGGDISKYINKKNRSDTFVIAKDGVSHECVRYINGDFFLNHHGWTLKYKNQQLQINKYMYYWLFTNQNKLFMMAKGSAQKGINRDSFYDMSCNLPTIEKQQDIVEYCDNLTQMINKIEQQIVNNDLLMKQIIDSYLMNHEVQTEPETSDNKLIKIRPIILNVKTDTTTNTDTTSDNREDLNKLTLPKLREHAKEKGLRGYSKLKKGDLISLILSK